MKSTVFEHTLINNLNDCRFQAGSFDKKFVRELDVNNISPLQKWYIYHFGWKYRKQLGDPRIGEICKQYLDNNNRPSTRRESERTLKRALKAKNLPPSEQKEQSLF